MRNLKIISLYKIIIVFLLITVGITYYKIKKNDDKKYPDKTQIIGIINNIKETETKTEIELLEQEKILVICYDKIENIKLGDKIKVEGKLEIASTNTYFNLFNYKNYLKSKKINYLFIASKIEVLEQNQKLKYKIKNMLINYINTYQTKNYLKTFILGTSNEIDNNIITSYQTNGISHLFAVSGMHLSLFAAILTFLLKKLKIKENINYLIIICFFIFFSFITNYSPSILRALILYILLSINKIFKLKLKTIYLILLDLTILLLFNPFYVYNVGFIFSFTVSISLILYQDIINNYKHYTQKLLITSLISFIVSIPISVNNFFKINLLTPIINLIFVPFVSFIIFPFSLLTVIIKPLDIVFLKLTNILEQLSIMTEKINLTIHLSHIPWYVTILYYIVIIIFIKGIKEHKIKKLIPLIILIITHYNIKYLTMTPSITMLDVGQGDSTIIELPHNKHILIDTGGIIYSNSSIVENKTIPYLYSIGIKQIDYLIITHGDYDHMGEAINLVENFKVEKVIFNCGAYNDLENELIKVLDTKKIKYYSCVKELNIDNNKLYFLNTKEYDNENDNSSVIYTELNNYKFLFMGDASTLTEREILDRYNLPNIDVLKVGHHGSRTSSSEKFIDAINPKCSIISVGANNKFGHPNKEVLETLNNSKIYRTDQDGSVMFRLRKGKLAIETNPP